MTWDLVEDIEKIRKFLKIKKWVVFGGSWASALSLPYSQIDTDKVKDIILVGVFTLRKNNYNDFIKKVKILFFHNLGKIL